MASPCCCPGCDQPGANHCSACKTTFYCGSRCQTEDWPRHKEECDGHLKKIGMSHFTKAMGFHRECNWVQALRHIDLSLLKLKPMKQRPIEIISEALAIKYNALQQTHRHAESLHCAKDKYNLWAMARGPAHPSTIDAAFYLIDSLLLNKEFEDAELFARTLWEIIHSNNHVDNDIPAYKRPLYVTKAADALAQAIYRLAESGGIPPEKKQKAGEMAIARARQSLESSTRLYGTEDGLTASAMYGLAQILDFFNNTDDDEILRLFEQSIAIFTRVDGHKSQNVAVSENSLGSAYKKRAIRASEIMDLERSVANLELALVHFREAAQIHRTNNNVVHATQSLKSADGIEEHLRKIKIARAAAAAAFAAARG